MEVKREEPYSFRINLARGIETDLHAGSVCWRICYKKVKKGREKEGGKKKSIFRCKDGEGAGDGVAYIVRGGGMTK